MRDPRSHRRYREAAARYIAAHAPGIPCALCGKGVDTTLSGMSTWGPTIEHRVPVRQLRRIASSDDHLLDLACDQRTWAIAHLHCQRRQGGAANQSRRMTPRVSRW